MLALLDLWVRSRVYVGSVQFRTRLYVGGEVPQVAQATGHRRDWEVRVVALPDYVRITRLCYVLKFVVFS